MNPGNARIVFMGTPDFSVPSLQALVQAGYNVTAVVTQPDRPKGRKRVPTPPPVKVEAERWGLAVFQPEKMKHPDALLQLKQYAPDLIVTAAYGQILPKTVLELPTFGCINVHASLLPKFRGGAPIHRAIMQGESETGVTIMYMAEGLDTGDMISRIKVPITDDDNTGTLHDKLSRAGAKLLLETVPAVLRGEAVSEPQNEAEATYAPNIAKEDERIDWGRPSFEIANQIRGLCPWPGAYTTLHGNRMKIWEGFVDGESGITDRESPPGTVLGLRAEGVAVRTGDGAVVLTRVQPAGKKPMAAAECVKGGGLPPGDRLGEDGS